MRTERFRARSVYPDHVARSVGPAVFRDPLGNDGIAFDNARWFETRTQNRVLKVLEEHEAGLLELVLERRAPDFAAARAQETA